MRPNLSAQSAKGVHDQRAELQRRFRRRLIWKAPLILSLVSFAVWWEWRKDAVLNHGGLQQALSSKAAEISGNWSAQITYNRGDKFSEQFLFQPEGSKLFGSASFLGAKQGIEEGRIEGENIAFFARFRESVSGIAMEQKNYYSGVLDGDKLRMRLQDDRGNPPLDFVLRKLSEE